MGKRSKNRVYISLLASYIVLSFIWIVYLYVQESASQKKLDSQLKEFRADLDSTKNRAGFLQEFLIADNNYILGDYQKASEAYEKISDHPYKTPFEQDLINLRKRRIDEIISHRDTLSADIEAYQYSLAAARDDIERIEKEKDSLLALDHATIQELQSTIEEMREELTEKDKKLNQKEKVQVISFRNKKGNLIHYLGEVSDEKANGGGVGIFDTGGIYRGEWKDNQRHGEGVYTWKDGHKYEGTFVEGIREGQGTYYWSSGEKYTGEWKNNKRNGEGTLYDRDNNIQYEGKWVDDKVQK